MLNGGSAVYTFVGEKEPKKKRASTINAEAIESEK